MEAPYALSATASGLFSSEQYLLGGKERELTRYLSAFLFMPTREDLDMLRQGSSTESLYCMGFSFYVRCPAAASSIADAIGSPHVLLCGHQLQSTLDLHRAGFKAIRGVFVLVRKMLGSLHADLV